MIQIETSGLVNPDAPVPINIQPMIDQLRAQSNPSPFIRQLTDALLQLQQSIALIWSYLKSPDEILLDSLQLTDGGGLDTGSLGSGSLALKDYSTAATGLLSLTVVHDTLTIGFTRNGTQVASFVFSPTGASLNLPTGGTIKINGIQVLTDQQAFASSVSTVVTETAGATYTSTEQNMLNHLKTQLVDTTNLANTLRSTLRNMGIMA